MLFEKLITLFRRPQTPKEASIRQNPWFSKCRDAKIREQVYACRNSPRSIYENSNMTMRLSGHFFYIWFGFLCAQFSSGNCETMESWTICSILSLKTVSHIEILIYRTWAIYCRGYRDSTMERHRLTHSLRDFALIALMQIKVAKMPCDLFLLFPFFISQPDWTMSFKFLQWIFSTLKQCFFFDVTYVLVNL